MSDLTGGSSAVSSLALEKSAPFSLANEKSVIVLLRGIHQSILSPEEKNTLRDLVFSFRSTHGAQVTPELQATFSDLGFTLSTETSDTPQADTVQALSTPTAVVSQPPQKNRLGSTRLAPKFGFTPSVAPVATPPIRVQENPAAAQTLPVETPVVTPHVPAATVALDSVAVETPQVSVPVMEAVPVNPSERIIEIKRLVNAMVGNPVNLIDVDNAVGREYMNALLDAMKKSNGGTPDEMNHAMARLEQAFVAVQVTMDANATPKASTEATVILSEDVQSEDFSGQKDAVSGEIVADVSAIQPVTHSTDAVSSNSFASVHATHIAPEVEPEPEEEKPLSGYAQMAAHEDSLVADTQSLPEDAPEHPAGGIMSVAKEKQLQDLLVAQKQEAATTDKQREEIAVAAMDPLMVPAVTNGLQQLLSEWSLFKSSGIFGTGPSGVEHPLYKKLATLTMSAVMAGRFEGATPQIKRSISDYMNGWRYEEGVLHEHTELFEHYLRRVIKHILEKQK